MLILLLQNFPVVFKELSLYLLPIDKCMKSEHVLKRFQSTKVNVILDMSAFEPLVLF